MNANNEPVNSTCYGTVMTCDSAIGEMVMFGGTSNETWTYNLSTNNWTDKKPSVSPPGRVGYAMAYDRERCETVLFGGYASGYLNDTWSYKLSTNTWTNRKPAISPPGRWFHSMAYDSANKLIVLFGGNTSVLDNDTWTYDLGANSWTNKSPANSPPAREHHAMAYYQSKGEMVIYSGISGSSSYSESDTWTYDLSGNTWTNMKPATSPAPRYGSSMAYDPANCEIVLVGGTSNGNFNWRADSWSYNLSTNSWKMGTLNAPSARYGHEMVYDSDMGEMVLLGGFDGASNPNGTFLFCGDTWTYNLSLDRWTLKSPTQACQLIEPRFYMCSDFVYREGGPVMAYDNRAKEMVLFLNNDGYPYNFTLNATFTYNLSTNVWTDKKPISSPPTGGYSPSMVYHAGTGEMVLFSSNDQRSATWTYNLSANTWTNKTPINPPIDRIKTMVYLESTGEILLLGYPNPGTWKYNLTSNTWRKLQNANEPPNRSAFPMAYDSFRNEAIMFGGLVDYVIGDFNDTWKFNLTTNSWSEIKTTSTPPILDSMTLAYEGIKKEMVLFGGTIFSSGQPDWLTEIWVFNREKMYPERGTYTSPPIPTKGEAYFGSISWNASIPKGCDLRVQFRSGNTSATLQNKSFTGPDGTADTSYANGQAINGMHNGSWWVQYRVSMNTSFELMTPMLDSLQIRYNLLQTVYFKSPAGNVNWSGSKPITWFASDPDLDELSFDIYLLNGKDRMCIATNQNNTTRNFQWNTDTVPSGEYQLQIVARDNNKTIPLEAIDTSPIFTIWHPNHAPEAILLSPDYGQVVNTSVATLDWNGSDEDGDAISYYILVAGEEFVIDTIPDPLGITTNTTFEISNLTDGATCFWSVIPSDGKVNGSLPSCWMFTVHLPPPPPINHAPMVSLLSPANNTPVNSTSVSLSWEGSDVDHDALDYFVFLSDSGFDANHLPLLAMRTNDTSFNASNLTNGISYFWAVIASDGKLNTTDVPVWKFTVQVVVPPDTPKISDFSPKGKKVSVTPNILVTFDREMDGPSVFNSISFDPPVDLAGFMRFNNTFTFNLGQTLEFETTYKVQVGTSAKSSSGKFLFLPFRWNFTTSAQGEIDTEMPSILLTDPQNGATNVDNWKNITIMFSEAMDRTSTMISCSISPSVNGSWFWLNNNSFALQFKPTAGFAVAKYTVVISSSARDDMGNSMDSNGNGKADGTADDFRFSFTVGTPQVVWPKLLSRSAEGPGVRLGSAVSLTFDRAMNLSSVQKAFRIEPDLNGTWVADVTGKILTFTPLKLFRAGTRYTITLGTDAADVDGNRLAQEEKWSFTTVPAAISAGTAFPSWLLPALVVLVVLGAAAYAYSRRKKTAAPLAVSAVKAGSVRAPDGFAVEEIFLMYNDGRLILHTTRRMKADMDVDVFASMLTAMQAFVKDSFGKESTGELGSMEFGGNKVLFEKGKRVIIAAVITGGEPAGFREEMKAAVRNIESEYATVILTWDGDASLFSDAKRFLGQLGTYKVAEELPAGKPKVDVSLKSEVEFYQGFIRLKVAIKNNMSSVITHAEFKLVHDREILRLDHIEPDFPNERGEVEIGIVGPSEKKAIAFYLDRQICTESYLEGILTCKDAQGNLETVKMPRKLTSVVCPILFTDENINTAMLKRMAAEELDKKDSKVFTIPESLKTQRAFEIGKAAVQHHDLRLVREFKTERPFHAEAWYFGKAKGRPERLIVRVRIIAEMNFLEFFVASDSVLMLTGMLAELKSDLNKELVSQKMPGVMKQVTSQDDMDAIATISSLLDNTAES